MYSDFFNFESRSKFDCIIGDIWIDQSPESQDLYERFREKALTMLKKDGLLIAWEQTYYERLLEKKNAST